MQIPGRASEVIRPAPRCSEWAREIGTRTESFVITLLFRTGPKENSKWETTLDEISLAESRRWLPSPPVPDCLLSRLRLPTPVPRHPAPEQTHLAALAVNTTSKTGSTTFLALAPTTDIRKKITCWSPIPLKNT